MTGPNYYLPSSSDYDPRDTDRDLNEHIGDFDYEAQVDDLLEEPSVHIEYVD